MGSLTDAITKRDIVIAQQARRIAILERERLDFLQKFSAARSEAATLRARQQGEYA